MPNAKSPPPANFWQSLFYKVLLTGLVAAAVLWLIVRLSIVTAPILIGFGIAYSLNPIVVRLRRWHVPSIVALTVPVLGMLALAVVFFVVVLPSMAQQLVYASQHAPQRLYNVVLRLDPWFSQYFGRPLSELIPYSEVSGMMQSLAAELFGTAKSTLGWVLSSARDAIAALMNIVLIVVVAFFLLDDYERIVAAAGSLVPRKDQQRVTHVVARIDHVLGGFLRGEVLLLSLATTAFTLGLALLDVPFALVMGPLAACLYMIPYVGVVMGFFLSALFALVVGHDFLHVASVAALFFGFYSVDLLFITPKIIGNRVGLPPLVVLLGIIALGELFGLIGVLIAIPLLATARILLMEAVEQYRHSPAFLRTSTPVESETAPPPNP